jgi:hypothetical protein
LHCTRAPLSEISSRCTLKAFFVQFQQNIRFKRNTYKLAKTFDRATLHIALSEPTSSEYTCQTQITMTHP